ncbi:hypothetical protein [Vibrio phage J14]|nr:hypothetical protein [Vibrio phage J14]
MSWRYSDSRRQQLAEYALINEEIANIELSGSALADATITEGSRYFRQLSVKVKI